MTARSTALPVAILALALSCAAPLRAAELSCANWLQAGFWNNATTADVGRCLAAGAKIDARNKDSLTPLHLAAFYGHTGAVQALLAAGAKVNARNIDSMTPLHGAAGHGHTETVQALLAAGARSMRGTKTR